MSKKKIVQTNKKSTEANPKKKLVPTVSKTKTATATTMGSEKELLFGRQNYILMAAGIGLIALGMILMLGGWMEDPNVWDENVIYSFRRTVLAPVVILAGLIVEVFAILK